MPANPLLAADGSPATLARALLASADSETFKPALLQRASSAAIGRIPAARRSSQPNYVSDLGLRPLSDPRDLVQLSIEHSQQLSPVDTSGAQPRAGDVVELWASGVGDDLDLAGMLDGYVSFAGDWDGARDVALRISVGHRRPRQYRTLLYCASVLGATTTSRTLDNEAAVVEELFKQTATVAPTASDKGLTLLRLAAWRAKKRHDALGTRQDLESIRRLVSAARDAQEISDADAAIVHASTLNLEALTYVRAGENLRALTLMNQAEALMVSELWVTVDFDAAYRYQTQIRTNLAQMRWKTDDRAGAFSALGGNLDLTATKHPSSRSEALSVASYYAYLDNQLDRAWELVAEAYPLVAAEGSPNRLAKIRKIAVGILDASGLPDDAAHVVDRITSDPLGFDADIQGALP